MTEDDLEMIRINLRLKILLSLVGALYTVLAKIAPGSGTNLSDVISNLRKDVPSHPLSGLPDGYSELISGEMEDAFDEILGDLERQLRAKG